MQQVEVLIVGQGMAGTALAVELINRKVSFKVIDNNHYQSSSIMSAGMYNPIVFKRITKSWLADESKSFLNRFCETITSLLDESFHKITPVARLFNDLQEQNTWFEKMDSPLFEAYLNDEIIALPSTVNTASGYGIVSQAGDMQLRELLPKFQKWLMQNNLLTTGLFDFKKLTAFENKWKYGDIVAKQVVFCEGFNAINNPYFNYLPIKPNKGQLLVVNCPKLDLTCVLNAGFFIQPLGNNNYRIGSTYEWDVTDDTPTEDKKMELVNKFKAIVDLPFKVIEHTAGIRPTVLDRRPLIGEHPINNGLYIFNGFGTKAVMLAPYCANELCDSIFENKTLDKEININRYNKLFE